MEKERISSNHITSSVKHVVDNIMAWACSKTRKNFTVKIDNDPEQAAKETQEFLKATKLDILQSPSQSPDLSLLEHASVTERGYSKAWQSISRKDVLHFVMSMGSRLKEATEKKNCPYIKTNFSFLTFFKCWTMYKNKNGKKLLQQFLLNSLN